MTQRKIKHVEEEKGVRFGRQTSKEAYAGRPPEDEDPFEMEYPWECFHYEVDRKEKIATVTLNNPGDGLPHWYPYPGLKLIEKWERDEDVKVVIFKSAGKHFGTGHSMGTFLDHYGLRSGTADEAKKKQWKPPSPQSVMLGIRDVYYFHDRLVNTLKPTIAQVHGYCINGAFHFAWELGLIIASDDAHLGMIGLVNAGGGAVGGSVPGAWGRGGIQGKVWPYVTKSARTFSARQACELGLINRVVPREKLDEEVWKEAQRIALIAMDGLVSSQYDGMRDRYNLATTMSY